MSADYDKMDLPDVAPPASGTTGQGDQHTGSGDAGGGGAAGDGSGAGTNNDSGTDAGGQQTGTQAAPATIEPLRLDPESIKALASAVAPKAPEQQMSQEEIDRALNVYNVSANDLTDLGFAEPDKAAAALNRILESKMRQILTAASLHTESARRAIMQEVEPLRAMQQRQQAEQTVQEFFNANKDLADKRPLVEIVYARMEKAGQLPKDKATAFKAVADGTRALMQQMGIQGTTTPAAGNGSGVSTTLVGGQGAATGSGKAGANPLQAEIRALFGRKN